MEPSVPSKAACLSVCLPNPNYPAGGAGRSVHALQKPGGAAALHRVRYFSVDVYELGRSSCTCSAQGLIAEQAMEEIYSCFLAKQLLHLSCPRKRKLQNFKWARIPESSDIFRATELGDLKTTAHSMEKWDFYKYVYQQMNN